ncbi:MAG TPA: adenylate/guanylate cyclase domain-containing protein [Casimicrobiaceae bacterium]|nr:adenylate/guanylate cyclase domain-containing protein [Casimicrobiaceae bacterium]
MSDTVTAIRTALDAGLNPQALDLARDALPLAADAAEIRYLGALACARMGAVGEADRWLAKVDRDALGVSPLAVDAWSLSGRLAKERYAASRDRSDAAARSLARAAIDAYRRAFALGGAAYPAVNAATLAMLAGDLPLSRDLAQRALDSLVGGNDDHWTEATAGEALLILGRIDESRARYAEAYRRAGSRFGDLASMRRQLLLIGTDAARNIADMLPAPRVVAFSGHMIDRPDRASPRFPARLEAQVAAALRERIAAWGPAIGYAQAACGADILFLEAMQDAGMQTQIVLPFLPQDYIRTSVSFAGADWIDRFHRVLERANRVVHATEEPFLGDDVLFEHAANLIQGMAFLRASELSTHPLMLTVLARGTGDMVGGTAATARNWERIGGRIENIDLVALRGGDPAANGTPAVATDDVPSPRSRSLRSLLFADVMGYSRMPEQYTPDFALMFLDSVRAVLDSLANPALEVNTHGDGIFAVFERPGHAADFAVRLQQVLSRVDWASLGLAADTGVRVGLHTGPMFRVFNPVTERTTFYGSHVNRAARLEPVAQPGEIFVTEEFASSLVADDRQRYGCEYIGSMPLAKKFGDARLYRLRWSTEI